jgi:hypothetical protein
MLCSRAIYGLCFYPFYKNTAVEISTPYPPQYTSRKQLKFVNDNKRTNRSGSAQKGWLLMTPGLQREWVAGLCTAMFSGGERPRPHESSVIGGMTRCYVTINRSCVQKIW